MNTHGLKRRMAALGATMAMVTAMAMPAFAATRYEPVAGTETTFTKYLIMDEGDNVPNATFSFTVAPGTARSADTSDNAVMQILPGVGTPTIADITFAPSDSTKLANAVTDEEIDVQREASSRASGLTATTGVELEGGEKYAQKTGTVSFSGITFDEPGIYRYIITETADAAHEAAGIMHDNDVDRVLDVYVTDNDGALVVSAYVLHTSEDDVVINTSMGSADVATAGAALDDKTDGFTNEFNSKDLVFKKEVTGNQASRDKWFEFTVKASDVNDNDKFTVSLANDNNAATTDGNADATSGTTSATRASNQGKTNPTEITGAQLKATDGVKFYLQHGQSIAIRGLAPNATYTVTEDAEDYQSTASAVAEHTDATTGVIGTIAGTNKAVKTSYQNTRNGVIPTGVLMTVAPFIGIAAIGGAGFAFASRKKKDEDD